MGSTAPVLAATPAETFLVTYAKGLHRLGVPAHRLEAALEELADQLSVEASFLSTPTSLHAAFGPPEQQRTAMLRLVPGQTDLGRLAALDRVGRQTLEGRLSPARATERVQRALDAPARHGPAMNLVAFAAAGGSAATFLSQQMVDVVGGALAGLLVGGLLQWVARSEAQARLGAFLSAFLAGLVGVVAASWGGSAVAVTLAGVVALLPGLSLTTALTELATGNLVSGTARGAGALVVLLQLSFGALLAGQVGAWLPAPGVAVPGLGLPAGASWLGLALMIPSLHVLLGARRADLPIVAMGCVVAWLCTTGLGELLSAEAAPFAAAFLLTALGNAFARIRRRPASLAIVPGVLLLVPGSLGFLGTTTMLADAVAGLEQLVRMALVALALAAGVLVAHVVVRPRRAL